MSEEITLREHLKRIAKQRWERMTQEERTEAGRHRVRGRWIKKRKPPLDHSKNIKLTC